MDIQTNIPIPNNNKRNAKWPWKALDVGDSFFMPCVIQTASSGAIRASHRLGHKYTCRSMDGGTRIWRIA